MAVNWPLINNLLEIPESADGDAKPDGQPLQIEATANLFELTESLSLLQPPDQFSKDASPLSPEQAERLLPRLMGWREERNLYPEGMSFQWMRRSKTTDGSEAPLTDEPLPGLKTFADWQRAWKTGESGSQQAVIRYKAGDVHAKLAATPDLVIAEDFRLHTESPGYRAGPDGKDLGADVDLVGPGAAYERWKKTPEYQQWLKDTGQVAKADTPKAEPKAFVVVTSQGVEVRKFDTLAEAVQAASAGDVIEIRGNGPFACDGVTITNPLVIRAGDSYTPTITLSQAAADKNIPLLKIFASLVLEGLELRRTGGALGKVENRFPQLLVAWHDGELHIANCRLVLGLKLAGIGGSPGSLVDMNAAALSLRNCELHGNVAFASAWHCRPGGRCSIKNCVSAVGAVGFHCADGDVKDVSLRVCGNTIVGDCLYLTLWSKPNLPEKMQAAPPIHLEFSRNVTHWDWMHRKQGLLFLHQYQLKPPLSAAESESLLPRLIQLAEKQNVYLSGTHMLQFATDWKVMEGMGCRSLNDWNQFWAQQNTDSAEGDIRFQGGDLVMRGRTAPEKLSVADFRLRPDSAGYRAGPEGKDLGANVDLVGPGETYERWKKTPEYQQWLKETKQSVVRSQ